MRYRCRHTVEAMLWFDEEHKREMFHEWFASHGHMFETRGAVIVIHELGDVEQGEWVLWMYDEFVIMSHDEFYESYEPASAEVS